LPTDAATVKCGVFTPDEKWLFTGGAGTAIQMWEMPPPLERSEPLEAVISFKSGTVETGTPLVRVRAELNNPTEPSRQLNRGVRINMTLYPETALRP
jgi:hypothetical protein